jgi:hypothetical protein
MPAPIKVYRMKIRVRQPHADDVFVMQDIPCSNAWDAEARAVAIVKRDFPAAYAIYAVSKKRVAV